MNWSVKEVVGAPRKEPDGDESDISPGFDLDELPHLGNSEVWRLHKASAISSMSQEWIAEVENQFNDSIGQNLLSRELICCRFGFHDPNDLHILGQIRVWSEFLDVHEAGRTSESLSQLTIQRVQPT